MYTPHLGETRSFVRDMPEPSSCEKRMSPPEKSTRVESCARRRKSSGESLCALRKFVLSMKRFVGARFVHSAGARDRIVEQREMADATSSYLFTFRAARVVAVVSEGRKGRRWTAARGAEEGRARVRAGAGAAHADALRRLETAVLLVLERRALARAENMTNADRRER